MTDKKLTDSEIVKALECCGTDDCYHCPIGHHTTGTYNENCGSNLMKLALDLINRLQAERDAWKETAETSEKAYEEWHRVAELNAMKIIELQAENEVLEARIGVYETCNARKDEAIKHLESEVKRLQAENDRLKAENEGKDFYLDVEKESHKMSIGVIEHYAKSIKAEAYKEFAERLDKEFSGVGTCNYGYVHHKTRKVLKELVGEDNES